MKRRSVFVDGAEEAARESNESINRRFNRHRTKAIEGSTGEFAPSHRHTTININQLQPDEATGTATIPSTEMIESPTGEIAARANLSKTGLKSRPLVFKTIRHAILNGGQGTHPSLPSTHYLSISALLPTTRGQQWRTDPSDDTQQSTYFNINMNICVIYRRTVATSRIRASLSLVRSSIDGRSPHHGSVRAM